MANIKSAKKRILVNRTKADRNKAIPKPQEIICREDCYECAFGTYIVCEEGVELLPARQLRDCIRRWAGLELPVVRGRSRRGDIVLELEDGLNEQEYRLEVQAEGIRVLGGDFRQIPKKIGMLHIQLEFVYLISAQPVCYLLQFLQLQHTSPGLIQVVNCRMLPLSPFPFGTGCGIIR